MHLEKEVEKYRGALEEGGKEILALCTAVKKGEIPEAVGEDRGEVIANLMLAYRHVEDARMRLGKVYQARNGGVSNSTR